MGYTNVEIAVLLLVVGAVISLLSRSWRTAGWAAVLFVGAAAAFAWADGIKVLAAGEALQVPVVSLGTFGSRLEVYLDPLGAGFLLLITGVSFFATLYSVGYMGIYKKQSPGKFYLLLQLFIAGMIGVVSVADWLFFIVFWELMTLVSYFLVTFERSDGTAVRAGFKYFIMTHVATAGLLLSAIVLWRTTGGFGFDDHQAGLAGMSFGLRNLLLALYLIAFATKAGIFPLGDWLPDAHPAAPSGVSAILSGVMIKLGAYGVVRIFFDVLGDIGTRTELVAWGTIIAGLGALSALVGGLTAMKENDCKRLLAYSSMSQAGYIFIALGIAVSFAYLGKGVPLVVLALVGAGFHIFNDAVFKSLLFMSAGSIVHSTGTRDLDRTGGLAAVMPVAAGAALVGAVSLCGLPPTNGFASKWFIYQSTISGGLDFSPFIAAAVIAFFVGMSTVAYSLKFFNTAFMGQTTRSEPGRPIPKTMSIAQAMLGLVCLGVGLAPFWAVRLTGSVFGMDVSEIVRGGVGGLATVPTGGVMAAAWSPLFILGALFVCFVVAEIIRSAGRAEVRRVPNWYGGEEHVETEVRYRAHGFYAPFNQVFANTYPKLSVPKLPKLKRLQAVFDLDSWLYNRISSGGGKTVDKISRSHIGTPQLYVSWQFVGMILVLALLFLLVR